MKTSVFTLLMMFAVMAFFSCSQDKGDKATVTDAGQVADVTGAVSYTVDMNSSVINWEGFKPAYSHVGTISLKEGSLQVEGGKLVGGSFVIDMESIKNLDVEDEGKKAYLEGHLKGLNDDQKDDFFNVTTYPEGKFEITKVTGLSGDENADHIISGNLTLKDITKEVSFKANVSIGDDGVRATTPKFNINRTDWNIKHLSGNFFELAADKVVSDDIALAITLSARK
jgi:polyisoprenoid-binding protein YceI